MEAKSKKSNIVEIDENPFSRLEVAEIEPKFVQYFSSKILESCMELYKPGNVIISGIEGSGKTMLLTLLKPEIRISYYEKNIDFPISKKFKFLGAGINFVRSGLLEVASRIVSRVEFGEKRVQDAPFFFGDFINYWVVRDIIESIKTFEKGIKNKEDLESLIGITCSPEKELEFVKLITSSQTWSGYLSGAKSIEDLLTRFDKRINDYRRITIASRPNPIPDYICNTITEVGEPISQTVNFLHESGILSSETPVLIRFDQYESLIDAKDFSLEIAEQYCHVINKFLWTRDPKVSFKIGSRPYALSEQLKVFGLGDQQLELERDYSVVNLGNVLMREENRSSWIFPKLAEDVFTRRLKECGYPEKKLLDFFGPTMSPHEKARITAIGENSRIRALDLTNKLLESNDILRINKKFLEDLAIGNEPAARCSKHYKDDKKTDNGDLLSAKLGMAWILQKKEFNPPSYETITNNKSFVLPWERENAKWWKKERINQALLQISSSSGQRTNWSGTNDILTLSGSNMLVFLNICREIWKIWDQAERDTNGFEVNFDNKPIINTKYQSSGIYSASSSWYNKVISRPHGHSRKKLIDEVGRVLSSKLKEDKSMSYPGHNGFSLAHYDQEWSDAKKILTMAVQHGDLVEYKHTPKNKGQSKRKKWYLLPILSPELKLPASHTKEPYYIKMETFEEWTEILKNSKIDSDKK